MYDSFFTFVTMNAALIFRKATADECPRIMELIEAGRRQIAATGSDQWQDGYPNRETILHDIERGWGYVLADDDLVVAYGAVVFDGEPSYDQLEGEWVTTSSYVVLHRLAVAEERKHQGVAREFFLRVGHLARNMGYGSFRVDTHQKNAYMRRLIEHAGFAYCGRCRYGAGERLAFEKPLH